MAVRRKRRKHSGSDLWLAPAVIGMRVPLLVLDAMSHAPDGREALLAVQEKALAGTQGLFAAQAKTLEAALRFWPDVLSGKSPSLCDGTVAVEATAAALLPAARQVRRNFDRLSKRR
ncbi:hypothetical protein [Mesorhizobium sp.]|uniref:hypothetical protein n=1 Tax=Mesorhizobium sp. TaxID=1871066 RepID=UPI000FE3CCA6|nr:hypothetical protein [Mesorhizobium sp.]RWH68520.1 MAG: hypothetical protein EOQ84_25215 [Mesorhizobium sp.]RWL24836.1 MAG: hypothetical protein EOR58_21850 [Mesorhizobium sp.]RWL27234.1 MAG: hypothetical protein EOR63_23020 [Mesorhizobium sp.]RWL28196.1 MAG: hypothetical protein EOR59_31345 [Mesorhizobium sp.]RWL52136.1 MAG: hypothetical protein EOR61_19720 [Mesorhizobium sp.]